MCKIIVDVDEDTLVTIDEINATVIKTWKSFHINALIVLVVYLN